MDLSPTEEQLIKEFETTEPFTYLGHGSGRVAFTCDSLSDTVLKVARWGTSIDMGNGVNMNQLEYIIYNRLHEHPDINAILPIFDVCKQRNWILQPQATIYSEIEDTEKPDWETVLEQIHARLGPVSPLFGDRTKHNIGYWNGNWYFIDYARLK